MDYIFETWAEENNEVLNRLYMTLINLCDKHGIKMYDNDASFEYFLQMMYRQSSKEIVPYYDQEISIL